MTLRRANYLKQKTYICSTIPDGKNWRYQRKGEELQKVIIHVDTNNTMTDTHKEILEKLISLKHQIENILPKCEVTISNLIMRTDEPKAAKINEVCCLIKVS